MHAKPQHDNQHYRTLANSPYYLELIALNCKPLDWVHPDWMEGIGFIEHFREYRTAKMQASVIRQLNIEPEYRMDFSDPLKRLVLLPPPKLMRLLALMGLSRFYPGLKLLIQRNMIEALQHCFGKYEFIFIQTRVGFLISKLPEGYICDLQSLSLQCDDDFLATFLPFGVELAAHALFNSDDKYDQALRKRFDLKLPKPPETLPKTGKLLDADKDKIRLMITKLALELEPLCTTLLK